MPYTFPQQIKYSASLDSQAEGFYAPFLDSRIAKEFSGLERVTDFMKNNALDDIKEKYKHQLIRVFPTGYSGFRSAD